MAPRIGTGRGGLHIGFINLLLSTDLQVDVVAGCSVLALVCAPDDSGNFASLKRWERLFNDCNLLRLIDVYMQRDDLLLGNRIFAQITQLLRLKHIEVLALPICIRVTNHAAGRKLRLIQADFHLVVRYCYSMTSSPSPISYYGYWLLGGAVGSTVTIIVGRALIVDIVTASSSQHEAQVMPRS